jgi:hypothetical protein
MKPERESKWVVKPIISNLPTYTLSLWAPYETCRTAEDTFWQL